MKTGISQSAVEIVKNQRVTVRIAIGYIPALQQHLVNTFPVYSFPLTAVAQLLRLVSPALFPLSTRGVTPLQTKQKKTEMSKIDLRPGQSIEAEQAAPHLPECPRDQNRQSVPHPAPDVRCKPRLAGELLMLWVISPENQANPLKLFPVLTVISG